MSRISPHEGPEVIFRSKGPTVAGCLPSAQPVLLNIENYFGNIIQPSGASPTLQGSPLPSNQSPSMNLTSRIRTTISTDKIVSSISNLSSRKGKKTKKAVAKTDEDAMSSPSPTYAIPTVDSSPSPPQNRSFSMRNITKGI